MPRKSIEKWLLEELFFVDYKAAASIGCTVRKDFIFLVFGSCIEDIICICSLENLYSKRLSWIRGSVLVHESK